MAIPLTRNSDSTVPDWMLKSQLPNMDNKEAASAAPVGKEEDIVEIRDRIERSARTGKPVFIDKGASASQKAQMREYAQVVGLDPAKIVEVTSREKALAARKPEAEVETKVPNRDPFGTIDGFAPESAFKPNRDWDSVQSAQKTDDRGRTGGLVGRIEGTETYEGQRIVGVRPGEASIASPNAIQELAESKEKTGLDRIRESSEERRRKIEFDKKQWEKDAIRDLPKPGTIAKGGIKLTDAGVQSSHQQIGEGQHSIFDERDRNKEIPDKTAGELLADKNEERRQSIQRPQVEDRSWDEPQSSNKPIMGDVFFESLKKQMKGIGK